MMKRMLSMLLMLVMVMSMVFSANAYTQKQYNIAEALNALDLFRGKGGTAGYDLDANLTRAEGATLLVRVLGKETEAQAGGNFGMPFIDVAPWAQGYVGYAWKNGITNGTNEALGQFSPDAALSDYMFLTLVLRALNYTDKGENAQFTWNDPYGLAVQVGLLEKAQKDDDFTRGEAVEILWRALSCKYNGEQVTLSERLIEQKVFTKAEFNNAKQIEKNGLPKQPVQSDKNDHDFDDGEEDVFDDKTPSVPSVPSAPSQPEKPSKPVQPDTGAESRPADENAGEEDEF